MLPLLTLRLLLLLLSDALPTADPNHGACMRVRLAPAETLQVQ
jgi:hypothetical protein